MRLTQRLLLAIEEALSSRLAGEINIADDEDAPKLQDYEDAWSWVLNKIRGERP